jgi:hypothetical protein
MIENIKYLNNHFYVFVVFSSQTLNHLPLTAFGFNPDSD